MNNIKKRLSLAGVLFLLITATTACDKLCDEPIDEPFEEPIDTSFTEYSLAGTSCQWANIHDIIEENFIGGLIIINSDKELRQHIATVNGNYDYPPIDFSKYTLLLAWRVEYYGASIKSISFQQHSSRSYLMTVNLRSYVTCVITPWQAPILVSKLEGETNVELVITK